MEAFEREAVSHGGEVVIAVEIGDDSGLGLNLDV